MNVLVAGPASCSKRIERGIEWAASHGATAVQRSERGGCLIALASSGGLNTTAHWATDHATVSAAVGTHRPLAEDTVGTAPIAPGTIAVGVAGTAVATTGEGNQRLFRLASADGPIFSSHVGALAAAAGSDLRLDRSLEDFLLGFGFLPDRRTTFDGIVALPAPGRFSLATGDAIDGAESAAPLVEPSPHDDLAELVCEVVDEQAGDAKTVGVLLGGFDSALVAAALHRTGRKVKTFTFAFDEAGFAQKNIPAAVAAAGAEHHPVMITPERLGDALLRLPARLNQPSPQPHYQLQTILAAEEARDAGAEVVFTGDGCDALFAAYPTVNTRAAAGRSLERLPVPVRRAALRALSPAAVERRLGHVARVGRSAIRASMLDGVAGRHLPTQYLDDIALDRLRRGDNPAQSETVASIRERLADATGLVDPARLAVNGNSMTGQSSSKVEGAVASTGLGVVSPFTHPRFRAAVAALPETEQRPEGSLAAAEGKPALQRASERAGLLPKAVIYQPKQSPTEAPVDQWFAGPLRPVVDELFAGLPFEVDPDHLDEILRPKKAEDLYRSRVTLSRHTYQAIGLLASYGAFTRLAG